MQPSGQVQRHGKNEKVQRFQADGVAFDREEHAAGICAMDAENRTARGELIAISIPVPSQRIATNEDKLVNTLKSAIQQIDEYFS